MINKLAVVLILFAFVGALKAQNPQLEEQQNREYNYFYVEGLRSKLWGKYEEAFHFFNKCVQINQDADAAFYELGLLYFQSGENEKGISMIKKAVENAPDNKFYSTFLANVYEQSGKLEEARKILTALASEDQDNVNYLVRLAGLYTREKKYPEAIEMYRKLYPLMDENENINIEIQRLHVLDNNFKEAIKEVKALIKKDKENAQYYVLLGDVYLNADESKKALKHYKKAIKINPEFSGIPLSMANYYQVIGDKASMLKSVNEIIAHTDVDPESKQQVFLQVLLKASKDSVLKTGMPEVYETYVKNYPELSEPRIMYGNFLVTEMKDTTGFTLFKEALEITPENKELYIQLLNFYISVNHNEKVNWICTQGRSYFPDEPLFYFYSAFVEFGNGNTNKTKELLLDGYDYAKANKELFVQFNSFLGDIMHAEGFADTAFVYYEKVLQINPNHVPTLNNYAYYLSLENKDLDRAEDMSARTVNLEPGNATYLDTYAWVLFKRNKVSLAKFYIERAMSNGASENLEVREHYADILAVYGDIEKAIEEYQFLVKNKYNVERNLQKLKEISQ